MPTATMPQTNIVNTHNLKSILLSSGWVNVKNCEIVPYSVGSSPQSNFDTGLKYTDEVTGDEYIVRLAAVQAFRGGITS